MNPEKHIFSIYFQDLQSNSGQQIIRDESVVHRIKTILRLHENEEIILFNGRQIASATLGSLSNKFITVTITQVTNAVALKPDVVWFLPILERDAFEQALQFLAVVGVNHIQPIITEKSRHAWGSVKDYERAHKMLIAGCEQAKQFVIPELLPVQKFTTLSWQTLPQTRLFCDPQGQPLFDVLQSLNKQALACFVGPEGDLTQHEKEMLKQNQFQFCALTPTILKAVDAVTVVGGILRTFYK
jgi:RsmE family RNA methyltransferase